MRFLCAVMAVAVILSPSLARAQGDLLPMPGDKPIVGMNTPALSPDGKTICFCYQGDLWTVPVSGGDAARLTVHSAHDAYPRWSPDGKWIAFASNRYPTSSLNYDIFLIPSTGGEARRLTYHTANDYPTDWSPDGSRVIFQSVRGVDSWEIHSIDVKTGALATLTRERNAARYGVLSPDGKVLAYNQCGGIGTWWRPRYHGSAHMQILARDLKTGKVSRLTDYDGTCLWPMYGADGKRIFYVTDELTPGVPNVVSAPAGGGRPALISRHTAGAAIWPSISRDGSAIVYVNSGRLYVAPTRNGSASEIKVIARSDDRENNSMRMTLTSGASEVEPSPDGKTLALVVRGDIWTVPSDRGGDAKRLTTTPANDSDITWSPDGSRLLFISDRRGNFDVFSMDMKTGTATAVSTDPDDEGMPNWSPDGKWISFVRSGRQSGVYVVPADASAPPKRVAESLGNNLFGVGIMSYAWSPDSKWLAFSRQDTAQTTDIWVAPLSGGPAVNVTYWPGSNVSPRWTADGKNLLFISARERDGAPDLYTIPLQRQKDESLEAPAPPPTAPRSPRRRGAVGDGQGSAPVPAVKIPDVQIDFDDIENRARRLTTQGCLSYEPTPDGKSVVAAIAAGGPPDFYLVPIAGGASQRMTMAGEGTGGPRFAGDIGRFFVLGPGGTPRTITRNGPFWIGSPVGFEARLELDRRAEISQAFNEFWRRINVGFYDPNMHGVDWKAMRDRYEPLLDGVGTREEFSMFVLSPLIGELNSSHSEVTPAPGPGGPDTSELGLTFDESWQGPGLKVSGWMPKGPNDDVGPRIKPGEYVLAIDGEDVAYGEALYRRLLDKTGKTLELTVNGAATKQGARTVKLKPISSVALRELEYDRRVKQSRTRVDELSSGRLAYIHIKGMDGPSQRKMERELWGRAREKDALVLDVRENGGGNTHDDILAQLARTAYGFTQPRDGARSTQPFRHWGKPIVLLINENSVSDAEIFPNGFRALKLGKVLGVATPGYVIGTYSGGRLQDGTSYRIPMWGWFYADGKPMENAGVRPDIAVENSSEDVAQDRDRQIEAAVTLLLKELPSRKAAAP